MPLVTLKQVLDEAAKNNYGVGAFNYRTVEQVQGVMKAAVETKSPVILQTGLEKNNYKNEYYMSSIVQAAAEGHPEIPVVLHLDHGNSLDTCIKAIRLGFTSVMIDGSLKEDGKTPTDFKENVKLTKEVVDYAHEHGVSVEGELGTLGGIEDSIGSGKIRITDPDEAEEFVKLTGVDALAVAIGNSHGAYKFKSKPVLAMNIISAINVKIPETPLVMHGSSSVPFELISTINKYGGKLGKTMGVTSDSIQDAIKRGVRKFNIDTDGRLAMTGAIRKYLVNNPDVIDHKIYFDEARDAIYMVMKEKMINFGSSGNSEDFKPLSLEYYKNVYKNGQK